MTNCTEYCGIEAAPVCALAVEDAFLPLTTSVLVNIGLSVELAAAELEGLPDGPAAELMRALLAVLVIVVWVPWVASVVPPVVWV